jgi:hypothetical protein
MGAYGSAVAHITFACSMRCSHLPVAQQARAQSGAALVYLSAPLTCCGADQLHAAQAQGSKLVQLFSHCGSPAAALEGAGGQMTPLPAAAGTLSCA